jgi:hypothetical protein
MATAPEQKPMCVPAMFANLVKEKAQENKFPLGCWRPREKCDYAIDKDDGSLPHVPVHMPFRETLTALPASSSTAPPVPTMPLDGQDLEPPSPVSPVLEIEEADYDVEPLLGLLPTGHDVVRSFDQDEESEAAQSDHVEDEINEALEAQAERPAQPLNVSVPAGASAASSAVQQPADVDDAGARSDTDSDEGQRKGATEGAVPQPAGDDDEGHQKRRTQDPGAGASTPSSSAPHRRRGPTFRSVVWKEVGSGRILAVGSAQETEALIDDVLKTRARALYNAACEEGYRGPIEPLKANEAHFIKAIGYLPGRTTIATGMDGHKYLVFDFELQRRSRYLAFSEWADTDEGDWFLRKKDLKTGRWHRMPRRSDVGRFVIPKEAKVGGHKKDVNVEVLDYLALFCVSSPSKV